MSARLSPARRAALKLFSECRRREARARDLMRESDKMAGLDPRDKALATRLVLGTIAARGELDRVLASHIRARSAVEPRVRDALRIAAFEILYMDTPDRVAVSQGVELVRFASDRAAGLANAVLRKVSQDDAKTLEAARANLATGSFAVNDLRLVGAMPEWLAARALEDLGAEGAADYARGALEPSCASVAVNLAKHTADEAEALLAKAGCEPVAGPLPGSFILGNSAALNATKLVARCDVLPCDLAAQEVVATLGVTPDDQVLEIGQGRGTKSILIAAAGARLTSVEVDAKKSRVADARMRIAGVSDRVTCVCDDGRKLSHVDGSYDLVFVDAPCSGTGTLSRHPEIAWSLKESAPEELSALQLSILAAASARVKPGGRFAYSTCSVLKQENEQVIDTFLATKEGAGFRLSQTLRTATPGADRHFLAVLERA